MKNFKKNELRLAIGEDNIDKLPLYYKIMDERPPQRPIRSVFSENHKGNFFTPEKFYKPISKVFNTLITDEDIS
jgi:hypothetical protein